MKLGSEEDQETFVVEEGCTTAELQGVTAGLGNVLFVTIFWYGGSQPRGGTENPEKVPGPDSRLCLNLLLAPAGREKGHRPQTQVATAEQTPSGYVSAAHQASRWEHLLSCADGIPGTISHPP